MYVRTLVNPKGEGSLVSMESPPNMSIKNFVSVSEHILRNSVSNIALEKLQRI